MAGTSGKGNADCEIELEDRETRSVSPELPMLPSIGEKPGPVRRDRLGTKNNPIDFTM